jgi:trimethylamine-N-oxide reductase (cytochrome c)
VVKIFNERGGVLGGAFVTERIMPGVISTDHGSKYDPIVTGELDRGGAINTIVPHNVTSKNSAGMATCGFLAEIERVDLDELRRRNPDAFNRPFHNCAGAGIESFLYKPDK